MGYMKRKKQPYGFRAASVDPTAEQVRDGVTAINALVDPTPEQVQSAAVQVKKPRSSSRRKARGSNRK